MIDANKMLDHSGQAEANEEIELTKEKLKDLLQRDYETFEDITVAIAPLKTECIIRALQTIKNPIDSLKRLHDLVGRLKSEIAEYSQTKSK